MVGGNTRQTDIELRHYLLLVLLCCCHTGVIIPASAISSPPAGVGPRSVMPVLNWDVLYTQRDLFFYPYYLGVLARWGAGQFSLASAGLRCKHTFEKSESGTSKAIIRFSVSASKPTDCDPTARFFCAWRLMRRYGRSWTQTRRI